MIRELRRRHRIAWRLLAVVLPLLLAIALWSRPEESGPHGSATEVTP